MRRSRHPKIRLTPERQGYIEAAMEHAAFFSDGAFMGYMQECGISVEELLAMPEEGPHA